MTMIVPAAPVVTGEARGVTLSAALLAEARNDVAAWLAGTSTLEEVAVVIDSIVGDAVDDVTFTDLVDAVVALC